MALKDFGLSLAIVALALSACDGGAPGTGAAVPSPNDVIDAVPTKDKGERGSTPLPVARPVARPQAQATPEPDDEDDTEDQTPTVTLNTTPPKVTPPAPPPPIVIVPPPAPAPAPEPEPAPQG